MKSHLTAQVSDGFTSVFGSYSTDVLILLIIFLAFFAYGSLRGKTRLTSLIFSLFSTSILFSTFPYVKNFSLIRNVSNAQNWSALIVFGVLLTIVYYVTNRVTITPESFGSSKWLHLSLIAISATTLVLGLAYSIIPFMGKLFVFSAQFTKFVHNPLTIFIFILLPLVTTYFCNRY